MTWKAKPQSQHHAFNFCPVRSRTFIGGTGRHTGRRNKCPPISAVRHRARRTGTGTGRGRGVRPPPLLQMAFARVRHAPDLVQFGERPGSGCNYTGGAALATTVRTANCARFTDKQGRRRAGSGLCRGAPPPAAGRRVRPCRPGPPLDITGDWCTYRRRLLGDGSGLAGPARRWTSLVTGVPTAAGCWGTGSGLAGPARRWTSLVTGVVVYHIPPPAAGRRVRPRRPGPPLDISGDWCTGGGSH